MTKKLLVTLFAVGIGSLVSARDASAIAILNWGQSAATNGLTLTNNNNGTSTITIVGQNVGIVSVDPACSLCPATPFGAVMNLSANSVGAAFGSDSQLFSGTFDITTGGGATNILSGTFAGVFTGSDGGSSFGLNASTPPDGQVTFTSAVLPNLGTIRAFSLSLTNLSVPLAIFNGSLGANGATTGNFSGNASANIGVQAVPEPTSMLLLGTGLIGAASAARRRRRAKV